MHVVPVDPAVERLLAQEPGLPVRSRRPAVCNTRPRLHCSPAARQQQLHLLQLLRVRLLRLEQLLAPLLAELKQNNK